MPVQAADRKALQDAGYIVARGLLDRAVIEELHARSQAILAELPGEHRARNRSQGSLVPMADHPEYGAIIGAQALRAAFERLAFPDPRFSSGYLISKPPGGPPLFWHQDWWGWDDPVSYTDEIAQVFVMIYLSDTSPENGCLRVIPGSHRRHHPLHDAPAAHGEALSRVEDPNHPLYGRIQGEIDVPVKAGDVVFGDARILHAAHANRSDAERSLLTLWYHPDYGSLPAGMRARIRGLFDRQGADTDVAGADALTLEDWPDADGLRDLFPPLETAVPHEWCRVPDWSRAPTTAA
ncbi:MAG: phytanoyl-CoA dioxygenase family protein [Pseudomonadota bacterium]